MAERVAGHTLGGSYDLADPDAARGFLGKLSFGTFMLLYDDHDEGQDD